MKKILVFVLFLSLALSSCGSIFHKASNNEPHVKIPNNVAKYQVATIHTTFGETTGPTVELQSEFPVFEYEGEDIQYARYITDLNGILSRESESWAELANNILDSAQEMCREDSELATFSFEVCVSCDISNENGYPIVTFHVREVCSPGSGGEHNYAVKYHTDDGTMIYRTYTETTRVF